MSCTGPYWYPKRECCLKLDFLPYKVHSLTPGGCVIFKNWNILAQICAIKSMLITKSGLLQKVYESAPNDTGNWFSHNSQPVPIGGPGKESTRTLCNLIGTRCLYKATRNHTKNCPKINRGSLFLLLIWSSPVNKPIFLQNQWSNGTMVQWSDHKHFTIFEAFFQVSKFNI